jgi:hypothetical protein
MGHIAVLRNEGGVIDVNETVADGRQENQGDEYKEQDAEDDRTTGRGGEVEGIGNQGGRGASGCGEMPWSGVGLSRAAV